MYLSSSQAYWVLDSMRFIIFILSYISLYIVTTYAVKHIKNNTNGVVKPDFSEWT